MSITNIYRYIILNEIFQNNSKMIIHPINFKIISRYLSYLYFFTIYSLDYNLWNKLPTTNSALRMYVSQVKFNRQVSTYFHSIHRVYNKNKTKIHQYEQFEISKFYLPSKLFGLSLHTREDLEDFARRRKFNIGLLP